MKLLQLRCSEAISIFKDAIKMAPSIDKEASGAGEQDAEGEDGAVRGARSQVTGSGALDSPPRLGSAVAPEAFHTEGSVFDSAVYMHWETAEMYGWHRWARLLRYELMCVRTGVR